MTTLREAAAATLAAGSCRLRITHFSDPPADPSFDMEMEGVADLGAHRVLLTSMTTSEGMAHLAEVMQERWPWLEFTDTGLDPAAHEFRTVYTRDASLGDGTRIEYRYPEMDPLWIVDVLGEYAGSVGRFRLPLDPAVAGEAWTDEEGRFARITFSRNPRRRPRNLLPVPDRREWRTLELFGFGLAVDIELPELEPPPSGWQTARIFWAVARETRRARREWLRAHDG